MDRRRRPDGTRHATQRRLWLARSICPNRTNARSPSLDDAQGIRRPPPKRKSAGCALFRKWSTAAEVGSGHPRALRRLSCRRSPIRRELDDRPEAPAPRAMVSLNWPRACRDSCVQQRTTSCDWREAASYCNPGGPGYGCCKGPKGLGPWSTLRLALLQLRVSSSSPGTRSCSQLQ